MSVSSTESISPPKSAETSAGHGARAVVHSIASKVLILALQASTGILTARMLLPWGRGELAAMILWPLFIASVTTLGVPSSLIYYLRFRPEDREELIANGFFMATILGMFATAGTVFLLPHWLHQYSPSTVHAAQWFLITVPLCSVTLVGRAVLEASHDFSGSNAIQIITPFATLIGLLCFVVAHHLTPFTAAIAYIAASGPAFWYMAARLRRVSARVVPARMATVKQILSYGIRSYGIDVLGTLTLQVDQVLVVGMLSPSAMGSYVVVLSLSRMLNLFQNSVVMVLFPKAAGRSADEVIAMTGDAVRVSGLVTAACGIFVCLAGPLLLRLLYGREYVEAAGVLRILVLEVVLSGAVFILAQAFMALDRPGVVTVLQGVGLSFSIPMMLVLIPRYGIYGAAVSLLTSTVARLIFVYVGFHWFLKTKPPSLVPEGADIRLLWSVVSGWRMERAA